MKLFIDSADPQQIKQAYEWGILDGVTTNPSLAAKVDQPYSQTVEEILGIIDKDSTISLEVTATEYAQMLEQARSLALIDPRVVVKVPCNWAGIKATKQLHSEAIRVNMTLVFSARQALLAAKAGAFYVSPFIGRLNDEQENLGFTVAEQIVDTLLMHEFDTEVLYASVRDESYVEHAAYIGSDIATVPFDILEKLVNHPKTDSGLNRFLEDWNDSGLELPT